MRKKASIKIVKEIIPTERITGRIFLIREVKVMLAQDLAKLYGIKTKVLNQAVTRNIERFPKDFMFQLTKNEFNSLRSQFVTLEGRGKYPKYLPRVFTEQGVAMLSSVLKSKRAIQVNIQIMRAFIHLRKMLIQYKDLKQKIEAIERKYDKQFQLVFNAIKQLIIQKEQPKPEIGFKKKK